MFIILFLQIIQNTKNNVNYSIIIYILRYIDTHTYIYFIEFIALIYYFLFIYVINNRNTKIYIYIYIYIYI